MTTLARIVLGVFVVLSVAAPARAQVPPAWNDFTRTLDEAAEREGIVGAAAVLVRAGQVVARHERGLADRERNQPVDAHTLFHYGSITKTLTAVALMQLVAEKRVSLDDRIVRWCPELRQLHDPFGAIDTITLRMILSHSAGFMGPTWPYRDPKKRWQPFEPTTWAQLVAMMPYQELEFRPGSRFGYSNPGYIYLARVIEAVSGDSWQSYVRKNILMPLGMTASYFGTTPRHLAADRADSYVFEAGADGKSVLEAIGREFDPGITIPNGGWNAPLDDLARWMGFLAGARDAETQRRYDAVLPRRALLELWRPQLATDAADSEASWMGLGFFVSKPGAPLVVGHTGSQAGFRAFFVLNPKTGLAVVLAVNTAPQHSPFKTLVKQARALVLAADGS